VVVSHHPTPTLKACLESVMDQADEVLVVDNDSPGAQASRIASLNGAHSLRIPRNIGFAAGANAGIARARGEVIALLNDDAIAGPGWLAAASSLLEDPTIAAVGPKVLLSGRYREIVLDDETGYAPGDPRPLGRCLGSATLGGVDVLSELLGPGIHPVESGRSGSRWRWTTGRTPFYVPVGRAGPDEDLLLDGEPVHAGRVVELVNSAGGYLRADGYGGDIGDGQADDGRFDTAAERFSVCGAALVATRGALDRVGRFEPRFFAYYEDTDWCWRARLMGLRLMYDPSVTVRHLRGSTSGGEMSPLVQHLAERNRLVTLLRNAPLSLALDQTRRKRRSPGNDRVAEVLGRATVRALAERARLRRSWRLAPREVFDRWAGLDIPTR
jgi:GT2 family glycosyltransferase